MIMWTKGITRQQRQDSLELIIPKNYIVDTGSIKQYMQRPAYLYVLCDTAISLRRMFHNAGSALFCIHSKGMAATRNFAAMA